MKSWIKRIFQLLVIFTITGCEAKSRGNYIYFDDFSNYLRSEYKIETQKDDNKLYYAIGIEQGCECTYLNLSFTKDSLQSMRDKLQIILVGNHPEERSAAIVDQLKASGFHIFEDKEQKIFTYSVGFGKPLFLHYSRGKGVYGQTVNDAEVPLIKKYLDGN